MFTGQVRKQLAQRNGPWEGLNTDRQAGDCGEWVCIFTRQSWILLAFSELASGYPHTWWKLVYNHETKTMEQSTVVSGSTQSTAVTVQLSGSKFAAPIEYRTVIEHWRSRYLTPDLFFGVCSLPVKRVLVLVLYLYFKLRDTCNLENKCMALSSVWRN
jgi:hypothetical protein